MHSDPRKRMAAAQLELVRALVADEAAPAEFDRSRLRATADTLLTKRAHSVARAWPGLGRSLGPAFDERFAEYARSSPFCQEGPQADGRAFARALARVGELADDARLEVLAFDLRYRVSAHRVVARRRFSIASAFLKQSHRLIIAIHLPLLGDRSVTVPVKII